MYLLTKQSELIWSSEMKCPKSEIIIGWGEWDEAILNETLLSTNVNMQFHYKILVQEKLVQDKKENL